MRKHALIGFSSIFATVGAALLVAVWAMSASAAPSPATALSPGQLSTDVTAVSPDTTALAPRDRTVEVALTNAALDIVRYVGNGPSGQPSDFDLNRDGDKDAEDVVFITLNQGVFDGDTFRVFLVGPSPGDTSYTTGGTPANIGDILPIGDRDGSGTLTAADIEIADEADHFAMTVGPEELTVDSILDGANGRFRFLATNNMNPGDTFGIRFATSPQETALTNVKGDAGNFDLLLVENPAGPGAEYSGTFVVADEIIIDVGTGLGVLDGIIHEQHDVPQGLRGNMAVNEEIIGMTTGANPSTTFAVTLSKAPIRSTRGAAAPDTTDVTINSPAGVAVSQILDAATGRVELQTSATKTLSDGDEIKISYRGSENFRITVDFGPIQGNIGIGDIVVPSDTDLPSVAADFFEIISVNPATGDVRLAVIVGTGDELENLDEPLPGHITVVGVTYRGSQQIELTFNINTGGSITATLDGHIEDANNDGVISGDDVVVVVGGSLLTGDGVLFTDSFRTVIFGPFNQRVTAGTTFAVAYAREVGANPRNALLPGSGPRPVILVGAGSRATVSSDDDVVHVDAESDPPEFENPAPRDGAATPNLDQTIYIEIIDSIAGVDHDSIVFLVSDNSPFLTGDAQFNVFGDDDDEVITTTVQGDAVTAQTDLNELDAAMGSSFNIDPDGTTIVYWWVRAADNVGNAGTSDADPDSGGHQGYSLRFDAELPSIDSVILGDHWDPDDERIEGDRRTGVGQYLPGEADRRSVRVVFNEDLDGSTVASGDFRVTDVTGTPLAIERALWFDASDSSTGVSVRSDVFLVLASPLSGGARVGVSLVGSISDAAGSAVTGLIVPPEQSVDGIAPTITITLDTALSSGGVDITVETDEDIRTLEPFLELYVATSEDPDLGAFDTGIRPPRSVRTAGENEWTFSLSIAVANSYSVLATAEDADRNRGTTGEPHWASDGAVSFEIDNGLPRPVAGGSLTTLPLDGGEATLSDPFFIEIDWLSEDGEYVGDSHAGVTLTKAVLDAVNVLPFASTLDGRRWIIGVGNIGVGEHTLTFNGRDDAGNTLNAPEVLTFTVVEPPKWELNLVPGMSLVSVPRDPVDKDINAVFGNTPYVDLVFTREGKKWLVAQRDPDTGRFERTGSANDLRRINSRHAYWVRATASATVRIELASLGSQEVPPAIQVKKNRWALVPVMSLRPIDDIPHGTELDGRILRRQLARGLDLRPGPLDQRVAGNEPRRGLGHAVRLGSDRQGLLGILHDEGPDRAAMIHSAGIAGMGHTPASTRPTPAAASAERIRPVPWQRPRLCCHHVRDAPPQGRL